MNFVYYRQRTGQEGKRSRVADGLKLKDTGKDSRDNMRNDTAEITGSG